VPPPQNLNPNLTMPSPGLLAISDVDELEFDEHAWEYSRNDLPVSTSAPISTWQFLEVRHREYLNTANGQPNDFSTTITRATKRSISR
jgi:hypothetical protein